MSIKVARELWDQLSGEAELTGWARTEIVMHHLAVTYGRPDLDPLPHYQETLAGYGPRQERLDMTA